MQRDASDLRGSHGSRTARVWYSENKIVDFMQIVY